MRVPWHTLDDAIAVQERRLAMGRDVVSRQFDRTRDATRQRLAQPDALIASAGLGALYGLWVTRPRSVPASDDRAPDQGRRLPVPGWLLRAGLSMLVSHVVAGNGAAAGDATADPAP